MIREIRLLVSPIVMTYSGRQTEWLIYRWSKIWRRAIIQYHILTIDLYRNAKKKSCNFNFLLKIDIHLLDDFG